LKHEEHEENGSPDLYSFPSCFFVPFVFFVFQAFFFFLFGPNSDAAALLLSCPAASASWGDRQP
jgi:hypothetical protein